MQAFVYGESTQQVHAVHRYIHKRRTKTAAQHHGAVATAAVALQQKTKRIKRKKERNTK